MSSDKPPDRLASRVCRFDKAFFPMVRAVCRPTMSVFRLLEGFVIVTNLTFLLHGHFVKLTRVHSLS